MSWAFPIICLTEESKARAPMRWVGLMNTLKAQVEEVLLQELVYI
ncbi:TnpV protein [Faecalibacterium prausnitzii]|uniref:TnpV protein n=1 Tax=Faecalibacterium prausnitzii TaxID=853 RepID=A0A2A7B9I2_9FIRM|nr:TnpV protein [Faecalibacterium prausnitzii]